MSARTNVVRALGVLLSLLVVPVDFQPKVPLSLLECRGNLNHDIVRDLHHAGRRREHIGEVIVRIDYPCICLLASAIALTNQPIRIGIVVVVVTMTNALVDMDTLDAQLFTAVATTRLPIKRLDLHRTPPYYSHQNYQRIDVSGN
jgi:hypothetical protein